MNKVASPPIRFGAYAFDNDTGELTKDGRVVVLRPQAAQILRYLAEHPGQLVTREDLSRELWAAGTCVDSDHGLNLCIHEIRAALRDDPRNPKFIETLPRRGYRFIAATHGSVDTAATSPDAPIALDSLQGDPTTSRKNVADHFSALAVASFALLLVMIVIVSSRSLARDNTTSLPPAAPAITAVALLPLTGFVGSTEEDYFASGVTWALQRQLESMDSLRVTSLRSVSPLVKARKTPAEIGRELKVSTLVSGSVWHHGERTMLNLKMVDAATGEPLWAESYDATLGTLPKVEVAAAHAIAATVAGPTRAHISEPRRQEEVNAEAHAVMLHAMGSASADDHRRELERAISIDPQFALPWSLLADSYVSDTWFAQTMPPAVGYTKAKEYALKALALDDTDSAAHTTIAAVKLHHEWDWAGAEREFKRAIALSPSNAFAHHIYSHYLLTMDRLDESVAESRIASDLDPLNPTLSTCVGWHCLFARQYEDAIAECLKLINDQKAGPVTYYYLGRVYVRQGKLKEGIAALEIADKKAGGLNSVVATLAYAYGRGGRRADAERALAVLMQRAQERYVAAFDIAVVHAGLGDRDETFEWLDRAFLERSTWLVHIKWDDRFADVRSDPRFVTLLQRMGIPNPASVNEPERPVQKRYSVVAAR